MSMSRKHFVAIAEVIAAARADHGNSAAVDSIVIGLCSVFRAENGAFSPGRFVAACEVTS